MNRSDSIVELSKALAAAQGELQNASKNAANSHFNSDYADLGEILNVIRPVFSKHGLAVMQMPDYENGVVTVETLVTHSSGEYVVSRLNLPIRKHDAQGVGGGITYARRYSLAAVAGIHQEDDDGNSAVNGQYQQLTQQEQQPQQASQKKGPPSVDKVVAAIQGSADATTINRYVQSAQERGASESHMQIIQQAATQRLEQLEGVSA